MTTEQVWTGAAGAVALVALVVALLALRRARRAETRLASVVERVAVLESPAVAVPDPPAAGAHASTFVITGMGSEEAPAVAVPVARDIDGRLFADIVARETIVKAASWTHGVRRALSAENRNRIRFEVRRETRRAGRDRRAETKQALREFRARERAAGPSRAHDVREDVA
ncbi:hypothetical protein SAMN05192575_106219 [Nocardioides alpinus]|uniref:Uncharacterized protein n=1 Tax=Nocardioides alpinus TaxID=748909 RepID=A0A1I0ZXN1_9ACTN|nr:hypothetical protein [Nocardioides alpinus]PKH41810.1 hypothetical protein CXG46_08060 [Nocardioides alpinus]SFB28863.1 hypothetical protein SAMN05192575_106219 [Nocardioides alpinus]